MNIKSEILLRKVYSVDTKAGDRLRYHIMRAEACPGYAEMIGFKGSTNLISSFIWSRTLEGRIYWEKIYNLLYLSEPDSL